MAYLLPVRSNSSSLFLLYQHVMIMMMMMVLVVVVSGKVTLTPMEQSCMDQTSAMFDQNPELKEARHQYAISMKTEMTSSLTMTAKYSDEALRNYEKSCSDNNNNNNNGGGKLHVINNDIFDCKLSKIDQDVELTLKNFANCLASVEECQNFDQEHLLEEAWEELGLHCILEVVDDVFAEEFVLDDDQMVAHNNKNSQEYMDESLSATPPPYIPKELRNNDDTKSTQRTSIKKFWNGVLTMSIIGGIVYVAYQQRQWQRQYQRRLPFGGVTTSRFQSTPSSSHPLSLVSNYHMLTSDNEEGYIFSNNGDDHHGLQLTSA